MFGMRKLFLSLSHPGYLHGVEDLRFDQINTESECLICPMGTVADQRLQHVLGFLAGLLVKGPARSFARSTFDAIEKRLNELA